MTPDDVAAIARTLVKQAIEGDVTAAKLILDRCCGKADSGPLVAVQTIQVSDRAAEIRAIGAAIVARRLAEKAGVPSDPIEISPIRAEGMELLRGLRGSAVENTHTSTGPPGRGLTSNPTHSHTQPHTATHDAQCLLFAADGEFRTARVRS